MLKSNDQQLMGADDKRVSQLETSFLWPGASGGRGLIGGRLIDRFPEKRVVLGCVTPSQQKQ